MPSGIETEVSYLVRDQWSDWIKEKLEQPVERKKNLSISEIIEAMHNDPSTMPVSLSLAKLKHQACYRLLLGYRAQAAMLNQYQAIYSLNEPRRISGGHWLRGGLEEMSESGPNDFLSKLREAIRESRSLLDLQDDWDDEGAVAITDQTWERATAFLRLTVIKVWTRCAKESPLPKILPGPDGSIDLHWETDTHELLINIPANADEPADFYGDSGEDKIIKGKLRTSQSNEWILLWLTS